MAELGAPSLEPQLGMQLLALQHPELGSRCGRKVGHGPWPVQLVSKTTPLSAALKGLVSHFPHKWNISSGYSHSEV